MSSIDIDIDFRWESIRIGLSIDLDYHRFLSETIFVNFYKLKIDTKYFLWFIESFNRGYGILSMLRFSAVQRRKGSFVAKVAVCNPLVSPGA